MQSYYVQAPITVEERSVTQQYIDFCEKAEPKPPYCGETPEGLKFNMDASGTQQYYTYAANATLTPTVSGTVTGGTIQKPMTYVVKP